MDLRMVKTRAQIKEAFLKLREKLMPEHIRVKDICEMAMINKTTFYNHYIDSAQLSDELEDAAVERVVSNFEAREKIFDDPQAYIVGLIESLGHEASSLRALFRGKPDLLCAKLEKRLFDIYETRVKDLDDAVRLSFAIGGFVRVVRDHLFYQENTDVPRLTGAILDMLESLLVKHKTTVDGKA